MSKHLTYSNVMATIAVFIALGGGAYAALGKNSVKSKQIKDGQVKTADLAADAVDSSKVGDGTLSGADVGDNALGGADINESSLSGLNATPSGPAGGDLTGTYPNPTVGADAIGADEVATDAIGADEVAADSLSTGDINETSLDLSSFFASARAGFGGQICSVPENTAVSCASTTINLPRVSRLLLVGSGQWYTNAFDDTVGADAAGDNVDMAHGSCEFRVDGAATDSANAMGERRTGAGASPWTQSPGPNAFARGNFSLTDLTTPLAAGNRTVAIFCDEEDGDIDWANVRLVAARVG